MPVSRATSGRGRTCRASSASVATRGGSFAGADHPALRASPIRHGRDKDVGVADQSSLDPLSVLVVQEPFPPVTRNVLGEKDDDDIVRMLLRSILEEPDERLDERS